MILSKIICYIKGFVTIIIEGLFPERFINICARNSIHLRNVIRKDKSHIYADMDIGDFKKLHRIKHKSNCKIHITKKYGLPFTLHKYRYRKALLIGIVAFFILLNIMMQFVWIIDITGNKEISDEEILKYANAAGLHTGMNVNSVNSDEIQNYIMKNMDKIGFVTVNRSGTTVNIDVRERAKKREHFDKNTPTNIIAAKSGVIEEILVQSGTAVVSKGDVVYEGQLLVSGADDRVYTGIKFSNSDANIKARVWHEKTIDLPAYSTKKQETGKVIKKNKLKFFNFSANLFIKNKILFEKYDTLGYTKYISLGEGKKIPIGIETTEYKEYIEIKQKLTDYEAKLMLMEQMDNECKNSEIIKKSYKIKNKKMTVIYECIEDITKEEEINDSGEISGG